MSTHEKSLGELVAALPPNRQAEVRDFIEFLLRKEPATGLPAEADVSTAAPGRSFEQCFGLWNSEDENSADNERIDADLAREYGTSHEA